MGEDSEHVMVLTSIFLMLFFCFFISIIYVNNSEITKTYQFPNIKKEIKKYIKKPNKQIKKNKKKYKSNYANSQLRNRTMSHHTIA